MNQISVFGKTFNKVEFFDYCYDTFVEADWEEPGSSLWLEDKILSDIRRSLGWEEEYRQWVADGAGSNEALSELQTLLNASPTA